MDDAQLAARCDANYFETFRRLAEGGGEVIEIDGLLLTVLGAPVAAFNVAFVTRPLADPDSSLREAIDYFDGRALPFIVRVREGVDAAAERALLSLGLQHTDSVPGMVMAEMLPSPPAPDGLSIRTVGSEDDREAYAEILAAGFGLPVEIARRLTTERMLSHPEVELHLGYLEGEAVVSGALIRSEEVAGVYNIATVPAYRRRGLGEAMTWHAVRRGTEAGCTIASLQSSEMGEPIYRRMGFRGWASYPTYGRVEAAAG